MIETCIPIRYDFNQENRNFKITTGRWFKGQEKVGWGEGRKAVAWKIKFMEKLESL